MLFIGPSALERAILALALGAGVIRVAVEGLAEELGVADDAGLSAREDGGLARRGGLS